MFVSLIENVDMTESFGDRRVLVFAEGINTNTFSHIFGLYSGMNLLIFLSLSLHLIMEDYMQNRYRSSMTCWREANMLQGEEESLPYKGVMAATKATLEDVQALNGE